MAEPTDDFLTVRVKSRTKSRLEDIQEQQRKLTGKRPTLSAIIEAALDALAQPADALPKQSETYLPAHREWHDKLEVILDAGNERDVVGIQQNIDWAVRDITRRSGNPRGRSKAG